MLMTPKLMARLSRAFNRTPVAMPALTFSYRQPFVYQLADGQFGATVNADYISQDLSQVSIVQFAAFLSSLGGFTVTPVPAVLQNRSALALLDQQDLGANGIETCTTATLQAYTSLAYAFEDTAASQLHLAEQAVVAAPAELSVATADGVWLDQQGLYYGNTVRNLGELDPAYARRIVATVTMPRCNNFAMANILQNFTGYPASVIDVITSGATFIYNAAVEYDGADEYEQPGGGAKYGLFDVYVQATPATIAAGGFNAAITSLVNQIRAVGTTMRNLYVSTPPGS